MSTYTFEKTLAQGRIAEGQCGNWLRLAQGWTLLPAYEIEIPQGKGPRLFLRDRQLVVPDIFAMKHKGKKFLFKWYESKNKSCFTWHYISKNWQDGIDLRHYLDYIQVQEETKIEVYLLFLHSCATPNPRDIARGSPSSAPTGLFGQTLRYLMEHEHHRDKYERGWRSYPMVYWNACDLERLASVEEVQMLQGSLWEVSA